MDERKSYYLSHIKRMDNRLMDVRLKHPQSEQWAKISILVIEGCLGELKDYILSYPFKKRSEEIYFFKYVKPIVLGKMIFMCEVYNIELFRPLHHTQEDREYLLDEIFEVKNYFTRNTSLYEYYKEDLDTLDTKYFVREVEDRFTKHFVPIDIDPVFFYSDRIFSTGFDYAFAKLRAMELLRDHLENELDASFLVGDEVPKEKLTFTGSQGDFVKLVEMINHIGVPFNPETGVPYTEEEVYQLLKSGLKTDLPDNIDFKTLKLISEDSDLPEVLLDKLDKLRDKWDEEERDIDYDDPNGDKPEP